MTINDKALVKLMKSGYKGGGVKIYRYRDDVLFLNGGYWTYVTPWQTAPGNVLGLIVEWLHTLPAANEGVLAIRGCEGGFEPLDFATSGYGAYLDPGKIDDIKLLDVHMGGCRAGQLRTKEICWFDPAALETMIFPNGSGELVRVNGEKIGRWYDANTGSLLYCKALDRIDAEVTDKLAEYDFWGGERRDG